MAKRKRQYVLPQMFDVRPVDKSGGLDYEKINQLPKVVRIEPKRIFLHTSKKIGETFYDIKNPDTAIQETTRFKNYLEKEKEEIGRGGNYQVPIIAEYQRAQGVSVKNQSSLPSHREHPLRPSMPEISIEKNLIKPLALEIFPENKIADPIIEYGFSDNYYQEGQQENDYFKRMEPVKKTASRRNKAKKTLKRKPVFSGDISFSTIFQPGFLKFSAAIAGIILVYFSANTAIKGYGAKDQVMSKGRTAYASLMEAKEGIDANNTDRARMKFAESFEKFDEISKEFDGFGNIVIGISKYVPYTSKLASGAHLAEAGKDISKIGMNLSDIVDALNQVKNPLDETNRSFSLLSTFQEIDSKLKETSQLVDSLENNLGEVNMDDIPAEQRAKFTELTQRLPQIKSYLKTFNEESQIFSDVLGGNGPRKYLLLFQNNQEMRATGGFIGTYGLIEISNGRIKNFFIDGIFNPDGQLAEKVVPPSPIQKISAAWSMHDSNWFPSFPVSAEKASWFYEKTGGPTVDGVIAVTPEILQKILEITGPLEMPEYGVTVDKDNFIEIIQEEVEVNYDKELNQPKKILADMAPKLLDRVFSTRDLKNAAKILSVFYDSLNEKQILIYSKNYAIEKSLSRNGWSGEILETQKDYISVINTNINGYKTDGVIKENIKHEAEIHPDGSIIDTVTITRQHNGGNAPYEWWNRVNADYMRVYVPKGSKLISVSGQTREFTAPPLDYDALNFKRDPQVKMEEDSMDIDDESGTRIYDDSGKTVFANWVYVSPQETAEIKYTYALPFRIDLKNYDKPIDTYSLLAQKQSGSAGSEFSSELLFPDNYEIVWKYPEGENLSYKKDFSDDRSQVRMETDLRTDKYVGIAFRKK